MCDQFNLTKRRQTIKRAFFAVLAVFGLLVSCTITPHPMDMTQAVESAKTRSDHVGLVKHYEDAAKEMQAKADAHKKLLAQYEAAKGLNNRQSHDLIDHCQRLIRIYEQAVATNMIMAESHRQLAAEAK